MNALNDQHSVLSFFDFSANLPREFSICLNLARLQRAPEGSEQSTCYGSDQIIDSCCIRIEQKQLALAPSENERI
jgi:hypothetical protein